jgi:hypothetical protein
MKKFWILLLSSYMLGSCSLFSNQKLGCKTNGKNIGAERILSGDKQAMKAAKKAKKFKY